MNGKFDIDANGIRYHGDSHDSFLLMRHVEYIYMSETIGNESVLHVIIGGYDKPFIVRDTHPVIQAAYHIILNILKNQPNPSTVLSTQPRKIDME